eukprot:GHVS01063402.1.p1 GENE.GHVS01063402.1~~GHVS01063402.1.p1  ORF type:complete len:232 (+),score=65.64 GHVS01063402.1:181-876(+)
MTVVQRLLKRARLSSVLSSSLSSSIPPFLRSSSSCASSCRYYNYGRSFCSSTTPPPSTSSRTPPSPQVNDRSCDPSCPAALDAEGEVLTEEERKEKDDLIKELTRRLSGPLADEHGNVPKGRDRPTAIEVDGPSHFYANSTRYTAYTKLKHRLLTRMGYKVLHVPYFEWRKMRGAKEREEYMRKKLEEDPSEWLDPEDEKFYQDRLKSLEQLYGGQQKKGGDKMAESSDMR